MCGSYVDVFRYSTKYNNDDAINTYLHHCIEKIEAMTDMQRISERMCSFVKGYGSLCCVSEFTTCCLNYSKNFTVQWYPYHQKSDCAVFTLLFHMTETMLVKSVKAKAFNKVAAVYPRILWSKYMHVVYSVLYIQYISWYTGCLLDVLVCLFY